MQFFFLSFLDSIYVRGVVIFLLFSDYDYLSSIFSIVCSSNVGIKKVQKEMKLGQLVLGTFIIISFKYPYNFFSNSVLFCFVTGGFYRFE